MYIMRVSVNLIDKICENYYKIFKFEYRLYESLHSIHTQNKNKISEYCSISFVIKVSWVMWDITIFYLTKFWTMDFPCCMWACMSMERGWNLTVQQFALRSRQGPQRRGGIGGGFEFSSICIWLNSVKFNPIQKLIFFLFFLTQVKVKVILGASSLKRASHHIRIQDILELQGGGVTPHNGGNEGVPRLGKPVRCHVRFTKNMSNWNMVKLAEVVGNVMN